MLPIVQRDTLADLRIDRRRDGIVADREVPEERWHTRLRGLRHLAFPRLTEPSLLRELLHESRSLTRRIREEAGGQRIQHEQQNDREQEQDGNVPQAMLLTGLGCRAHGPPNYQLSLGHASPS